MTKQELKEIADSHQKGDFANVHRGLKQAMPQEWLEIAEHWPELIWEGAAHGSPECEAMLKQTRLRTPSHSITWTRDDRPEPSISLGWVQIHGLEQPKFSSAFNSQPLLNPQRALENMIHIGGLESILYAFRMANEPDEADQQIAEISLRPEWMEKIINKYAKNQKKETEQGTIPFQMALELLKGQARRIPKWAAALADYEPKIIRYDRSVLYTECSLLQQLKQNNYEGIASMSILWPQTGERFKDTHPGCDALPKLRHWNPKTQPIPLTETELEKLSRWKNRKTLREWGITPTILRNAKQKVCSSIWDKPEQNFKSRTFTIQEGGIMEYGTKNSSYYVPNSGKAIGALGFRLNEKTVLVIEDPLLNETATSELKGMIRHLKHASITLRCYLSTATYEKFKDWKETRDQLIIGAFIENPGEDIINILDALTPEEQRKICQEGQQAAKARELTALVQKKLYDKPLNSNGTLQLLRTKMVPHGYTLEPETLSELF